MNDNRVDRSQHVTGGPGVTMVAGGDQTGNTVTTNPPDGAANPPTFWDRLITVWSLLLMTVVIGLAVAGIVLGLTHTLSWTKAAIPLALAALAAVGLIAKMKSG